MRKIFFKKQRFLFVSIFDSNCFLVNLRTLTVDQDPLKQSLILPTIQNNIMLTQETKSRQPNIHRVSNLTSVNLK